MRRSPTHRNRRLIQAAVAAVVLAGGGGLAMVPSLAGAATTCADVDVVVARGTGEPGRLGVIVGDRVFAALGRALAGRTLSSHAVDYPASLARGSAAIGNRELVEHVTDQAAACPDQRFVLVGYSQGANVVGNSLGVSSAGAVVGADIVAEIPPEIAPQVGAVLLFGNPIRAIGRRVTGDFADRTLDICASGDPVCGGGRRAIAHLSYGRDAARSAAFAAGRV
jgi:cutinase